MRKEYRSVEDTSAKVATYKRTNDFCHLSKGPASFCQCIFIHARSCPSRTEVNSFFVLCMVHWLLHAVRRFLIQIGSLLFLGYVSLYYKWCFPLQESHKISYEIRNLPLAVVKERKQGFILFGCGKGTHNCQNTHYPVMKRSSTETQVHFHYLTVTPGTSLSKIETASADTYQKKKIQYKSFY